MAAAPAIMQFVGGTPRMALGFTRRMYEITFGEHAGFTIPVAGFPRHADRHRRPRRSWRPASCRVVNTGIAHKEPGVGMVGAGLVQAADAECFHKAVLASQLRRDTVSAPRGTTQGGDVMKLIDLTIPLGIGTPAWPTYEPLQVKYFKRLAPNGANGQVLTHSNHLGTHLDGEIHFYTPGQGYRLSWTWTSWCTKARSST